MTTSARTAAAGLALFLAASSITAPAQSPTLPPAVLAWRDLNPNQSNTHTLNPDGASGGRVNGLSAATDKSVIFAASEWGGLYRSTNVGRSWSHVDGHLPMATWQVAVDPTNPKRVYATSFYDGRVMSNAGVNVSSDGGNTWVHPPTSVARPGFCDSTSRSNNPSAFGIAINRAKPSQVFVGTNCGLIASADAGDTWRYVYPVKSGIAVDVWSVVVHDSGMIDICGELGHSRSTDGGKTWSAPPQAQLPAGRCSITASPRNRDHLIATVGQAIYRSLNGGQVWERVPGRAGSPETEPGRVASIAVNERTGPAYDIWYGNGNLFRTSCAPDTCPFARFPGDTLFAWSDVGVFNGAHLDMGVVLFDPTVSVDACPLLLSNDGGIEINAVTTSPACHTPKWVQPDTTPHALWILGMQLSQVTARDSTVHDSTGNISVVPINRVNVFHRLFFGTQDNGAFQTNRANSDPLVWDNTDPADAADVVGGARMTVNSVCCFPEKRLFMRHVDEGAIVDTNAKPLVMPGRAVPLMSTGIIAQVAADFFAVLTDHGLYVSHNVNVDTTWTQLGWPTALPDTATPALASVMTARPFKPVFFVRIDSTRNPSQLYELDGVQLHDIAPPVGMSLDIIRWHRIQPPDNVGGFGVVTVDESDPKRIFGSYERLGRDPQMIQSTDGGITWNFMPKLDACMTAHGMFRYRNTRGPTGIGAGIYGFAGYAQPTLVAYAPSSGVKGDTGRVMIAGAADAGIFMSFDHGEHWTLVSDPFKPQSSSIPHIPRPRFARSARGPLETTIYFGTQGRGTWSGRYPNSLQAGTGWPEC